MGGLRTHLHRKEALTPTEFESNFRTVDDRKGWQMKIGQSEVDWVIQFGRVTYRATRPEKTD